MDAEGSGIPEVKCIMSGLSIYKYLGFKTLCAKIIGLIAGVGAGLRIGKEGPLVHLSASIAHNLTKLKCFKAIESSETVKKQMLGAAVAAGISSALGAPIGGVLFSMEVTATYYVVSNLWKAFFCSI